MLWSLAGGAGLGTELLCRRNGETPERLKLSQQKEVCAIKNAVIWEAERVRLGETTFEDADMDLDATPENEDFASAGYWVLKELILGERESLEEQDCTVERLKQTPIF